MPSDLTFDENLEVYRDGTGDFATNADETYVRDRIVREIIDVVREELGPLTPSRRKKIQSNLEQRLSDLHVTDGSTTVRILGIDPSSGTVHYEISVGGETFSEQIPI